MTKYRFTAARQRDWNGKAVWYIYEPTNGNIEHIATMLWSPHSQEYRCNWHIARHWGTDVREWRKAIKEVEA